MYCDTHLLKPTNRHLVYSTKPKQKINVTDVKIKTNTFQKSGPNLSMKVVKSMHIIPS